MIARRYLLRLYQGMSLKEESRDYLDHCDDSRLRELLEERVHAVAGTLNIDLSQNWELRVLGIRGGPIHARVSVDRSGRTVIKR